MNKLYVSSRDKVEAICRKVGGLRPHPTVTEDEWAKWLKGWKEFPLRIPCPQCDGHLVEKSGKYGDFLGCSNYPDCKFTRKVG